MLHLTLRTLLAYLDDTLEPAEARALGKKVAQSEDAKQIVDRIKRVTRRRGLAAPVPSDDADADPNTVAEYLDNALEPAKIRQVEETCLDSDVHLAEVAACHQILTLVLTEPVRVPPHAHRRMYQLVQPPAAIHDRRPNKTLPISGAPPAAAHVEPDDADAALLLGMKRYSSTNTWAARFALIAAAAVLFVLLTGAVLLTLQQHPQTAPEIAAGHSSDLQVSPKRVAEPPQAPKDTEPVVVVPVKPKDPAPGVTVPPMPIPRVVDPNNITPVAPMPGVPDPVQPPNNDLPREIAQVKTTQVLVVTQPPEAGGQWRRLRLKDTDDEPVMSNYPVMALPGYKADLIIDKRVQLRLWGNVPEQLQHRVLESRVKIHRPPVGFDADITLLAGRIYLKSEKADGANVRIRLAGEVWDVKLPNGESNVLVELISWFEPGTVYAPKEGTKPKLEGRLAVAFGTASFETRGNRFKKIPMLTRGQQVTWDSVKNTLSDATAIEPERQMMLLDSNPIVPGKAELYKNVTRLLSNMAGRVTTRETVYPVVKSLVGPDLPADVAERDRDLVARLAVYSHAALADSTEAGAASLTPLVDLFGSKLPWLARQAVVTALVQWLGRDRDNTALLHAVLTSKGMDANDADVLLRLLRGYIAPVNPDIDRLNELVEAVRPRERPLLGDPEVAIREAALWNLLVVQQKEWIPLPALVNVGGVGAKVDSDEYKEFLKAWKAEVETIKKSQKKP